MLQNSTLQFLSALAQNNEKAWFDANKKAWQAVRQDVEKWAARVIEGLGKTDPGIAHLEPKQCMFRINRDVRFSNDKSPYKTNMGMWMNKGGKKSPFAGYYIHIEPGGKSFFGGGIYMPMPPELKKVRQEIAYCTDEFENIVNAPSFKAFFDGVVIEGHSLTRVPAGYEADHRAAQWLKLKSFFGVHPLGDNEITSDALTEKVVKGLSASTPLVHFINRSLEEVE